MTVKAGRSIGSKVKLTPFARKVYPQFAGKVGRITKKDILTKGHGLARGLRSQYHIGYWVRFEGENRDYLLGAGWLMKA